VPIGRYTAQILANAKALAAALMGEGWRLVSGGTDNHLMLVDVFAQGITGKAAEAALDRAGITVNKNTIPFDTNSPMVASGIRIGTPALTTRGFKDEEARITANLIAQSPDLLSSTDVTYLPIPQGFVAVQVPTSELVGVGGYVQLGDRITVLATINTSVFGASPGVSVVRTVFRNLYVIRVGPASASNAAAQLTSSLTVLMTACDSEYMNWLLTNAILKYTLESYKDYQAAPTQPDSSCPTIESAGGVGPRDVDKKWGFTSATTK